MSYYKRKPDPHLINKSFASAVNAYLHLRGAGREITAHADPKKTNHLLIAWGNTILPQQLYVKTEPFVSWLNKNRPSIDTITSILNQKIQKPQ